MPAYPLCGLYTGAVDETLDTPPTEGACAPPILRPAVVEGEKAAETALAEGMFPVVDKTVNVFAVPSAPGWYMYIHVYMYMYITAYCFFLLS